MPSDDVTQRWLEQTRVAWDERADMFNELSSANAKADDRKAELDFVFAALGVGSGDRVLDAGCGPGHFAIAFAKQGCVVDGIDISPEMIARARENAADAKIDISFSVGDLVPLNASDRAYAAIVSRMVLPVLSAPLGCPERVPARHRPGWETLAGRTWFAFANLPALLEAISRGRA